MERIDFGSDSGIAATLSEDAQAEAGAQHRRALQEQSRLSQSLADGQIVIISARWLLVLTALMLTLWTSDPNTLSDIRLRVPVLLLLAIANFYLHAQVLMRRSVAANVIYAASAADMVVISLLLLAQGGFEAPLYIFYFPAILAFSVAFPATITACFTAIVIGLYASLSLPSATDTPDGLPVLVMRLLMIAAVAVCGQVYWRVEQSRRNAGSQAFDALLAQARRTDEPTI